MPQIVQCVVFVSIACASACARRRRHLPVPVREDAMCVRLLVRAVAFCCAPARWPCVARCVRALACLVCAPCRSAVPCCARWCGWAPGCCRGAGRRRGGTALAAGGLPCGAAPAVGGGGA